MTKAKAYESVMPLCFYAAIGIKLGVLAVSPQMRP